MELDYSFESEKNISVDLEDLKKQRDFLYSEKKSIEENIKMINMANFSAGKIDVIRHDELMIIRERINSNIKSVEDKIKELESTLLVEK